MRILIDASIDSRELALPEAVVWGLACEECATVGRSLNCRFRCVRARRINSSTDQTCRPPTGLKKRATYPLLEHADQLAIYRWVRHTCQLGRPVSDPRADLLALFCCCNIRQHSFPLYYLRRPYTRLLSMRRA